MSKPELPVLVERGVKNILQVFGEMIRAGTPHLRPGYLVLGPSGTVHLFDLPSGEAATVALRLAAKQVDAEIIFGVAECWITDAEIPAGPGGGVDLSHMTPPSARPDRRDGVSLTVTTRDGTWSLTGDAKWDERGLMLMPDFGEPVKVIYAKVDKVFDAPRH